jgi:comEA protein
MNSQKYQTKVLIATGLLLSSAIIFYNVFSPSQTESPNIIQIDKNNVKTASSNVIIEENNNSTQEFEPESASFDEKIDINTANELDLEKIPGIGPQMAQKIIEYKKNNGLFKDISELKNIDGIGENKLAKIQDFAFVENSD